MNKTNVKASPSTTHRHDTPSNKTHVIKFRVTAEEKASLELTCKLLNSLTLLSKCFRLWLSLWVPVSACGVPSTCWKVTVTTTPAAMLMVNKEATTKKARTANPHRYSVQPLA